MPLTVQYMVILPEHIVSLTVVDRFRLFWFTSVFILCLVFVSGLSMHWNVSLELVSSMHPHVSHKRDVVVVIVLVRFTIYLLDQCLSPLKFEFEPRTWRGVLDTTLCDKVCQ